MKVQDLFRPVVVAGCCLASVSLLKCSDGHHIKPNIILVLADDQGWGDMAYNGHPVLKTPNFDEMSKTGLRFDRFYSAAPVSSPTRGSIMTGRNPNRFGCFSWGNTLRPQEKTLAEGLKKAGYVSGHFGKWHLGSVFEGSPVNPGASGFDEWFSAPNFFDNDPILSREGIAVQTKGESSMVVVDAALEFIKKHKDSPEPFFAFVCFGSPHLPHIADEQDKLLYPGQEEKLQNFYGEISGMDRAFGKLRSEIRKMNIHKNTILWYCSDNGGIKELSSTGGREHKGSIYEGGLRVPSILEWPKYIKHHRITKIPCNTSDIYPTLLEIAGVKINDQAVLDGISLLPLLKGEIKERPEPMGFWQYTTRGEKVASHAIMLELLNRQQSGDKSVDSTQLHLDAGEITEIYSTEVLPGHSAWLNWPFKFHRISDINGDIKYELYNLEADPYEENNLVDKEINRVNSMKAELEKWQVSVVESLNGKDYKK